MLTVTKEFHWEMAHMLTGHSGLCKNLHGHSYKMEVEVAGQELDSDMIIDFKDLKGLVNELIVTPLDHSFVYDRVQYATDQFCLEGEGAVESQIAKVLQRNHLKCYGFEGRPTAETMVRKFWQRLEKPLEPYGIQLVRISLWETATSYATYRGEN